LRILFVEDEKKITDAVKALCEVYGYECNIACDGDEGLLHALSDAYDVVVLDIMLPGISGLDIVKKMRENKKNTAVLMLTAKSTIDDRVLGLKCGADDYLTKPFSAKELFARIEALHRRSYSDYQDSVIILKEVSYDVKSSIATIAGKIYQLPQKEAKLLELLLKHPGQVFSREQILDKIWGLDSYVTENNIEIHIHNLRKRLSNTSLSIRTVRGIGYVLKVN
jgi:DNA-binding response OmpR family regulator